MKDYPLYSQDGKERKQFAAQSSHSAPPDGFILEGEREGGDTIMFAIVTGLIEDEYGYVSLNELSEVELDLSAQGYGKLQVRQQTNFKPTALKNLRDDRLQKFLARFED